MKFDELYQEIILDHSRSPRNYGPLENPTVEAAGENPSCGDEIALALRVGDETIADARFTGQGCAICMASASMMTRAIKGKSPEAARAVMEQFQSAIIGPEDATPPRNELAALAGVRHFPQRVRCALLSWEALDRALSNLRG
jgi:nitrogen fixation NifU-like protein